MPTYHYECEACGKSLEVMHSISEPRLKKCPKCGKLKLRRHVGGGSGGIIFKGSGFYETDYKQKKPSPAPACPAKDSSSGKSAGCASCPMNKK